ncbi:hypothetical protein [Serratia rubidaea]|uniref:hypothetical protein n=1 Tax=Serratia rubidaea TaxID=61652 RepID=UPI001BB01F3B|nr:hypothetical protein [Serratia rubidaea]MBS0974914.1 hypothetical protein [Serratia rubidaea]MDC6110187.1 hypothetical protein [Serratia rubidaea]
MASDKKERLSIGKRMFHSFLEYAVSLLGGALFFLCIYWFFHFETWHERFIYIAISIAAVYLIVKILPERPDE